MSPADFRAVTSEINVRPGSDGVVPPIAGSDLAGRDGSGIVIFIQEFGESVATGLVAHRLRELLHVIVGGRNVGNRAVVRPVPASAGVTGGVQDYDDD